MTSPIAAWYVRRIHSTSLSGSAVSANAVNPRMSKKTTVMCARWPSSSFAPFVLVMSSAASRRIRPTARRAKHETIAAHALDARRGHAGAPQPPGPPEPRAALRRGRGGSIRVSCSQVSRGGRSARAHVVSGSFRRICDRAGIACSTATRCGVHFHDLPHSCASLLFAQRIAPRTVMEILDHSQIGITMNRYTHVPSVLMGEAAAVMDRARGS